VSCAIIEVDQELPRQADLMDLYNSIRKEPPMGDRMTPVEAAKKLDIRPQQVYGFIKHNRVHTYPNPSGKANLVDFDEVKAIAGGVRHHREKDPTTGKPVKRDPGVKLGDVLSTHVRTKYDFGDGDPCEVRGHGRKYKIRGTDKQWCPHSDHTKQADRSESRHNTEVVVELIRNEQDEVGLIRTVRMADTDAGRVRMKESEMYWEPDGLQEALSQNRCKVQTPEDLLATAMYAWELQGQTELAVALADWAEANSLQVQQVEVSLP